MRNHLPLKQDLHLSVRDFFPQTRVLLSLLYLRWRHLGTMATWSKWSDNAPTSVRSRTMACISLRSPINRNEDTIFLSICMDSCFGSATRPAVEVRSWNGTTTTTTSHIAKMRTELTVQSVGSSLHLVAGWPSRHRGMREQPVDARRVRAGALARRW